MQQEKATGLDFYGPRVIEERNKLIAERIGIKLGYNSGKIETLLAKINILSEDPAPRKALEYLYEKLWIDAKTRISRDDVQGIITTCQVEAFDKLLKAGADGWN